MSDTGDAIQSLVEKALSGDAEKHLKKMCQDITDDIYGYIEYQLRDDLTANLASLVQQMVDKAITALLNGDEELMRQYLACQEYGYTGRQVMERSIVIHGILQEHEPLVLRRKLVDRYADILKTERILDLEAQVAALVTEVNCQKADIEQVREWRR